MARQMTLPELDTLKLMDQVLGSQSQVLFPSALNLRRDEPKQYLAQQ